MTDAKPTDATPDDANPGDKQGDAGKAKVEFTAEQTAEIGRLLAKERREASAKAKADADAARVAADEEAKQARERDEAAARGEFDKVRAALEADAKAAKDESAALKAENDQLRAAVEAVLADEWKQLPAEVRDAYLGADDDPLAKLAFLPKAKKLAAKLAERDPAARGNGPDPKPGGPAGLPSIEDTKREFAQRLGVRRAS